MSRELHAGKSIAYATSAVAVAMLTVACSSGGSEDSGESGLTGFGGSTVLGGGGSQFVSGAGGAPTGVAGTTSSVGGASTGAGGASSGACPADIFKEKCAACHDGLGTAATPMGLKYYEDFVAPSPTSPSTPVYQSIGGRIRSTSKPMPPTGILPESDLAAIEAWIAAGAPDCGFATAGSPPGAGGGGGGPPAGTGGLGSVGGGGTPGASGSGAAGTPGGPDVSEYLSPDGTYFIKEPPGDKPVGPDAPDADYCFNIVAHGAQTPLPGDPSPFSVKSSEFYHNFDYKVPYTQPSWALSTKPIIDNNKVLHHWLFFYVLSGQVRDGAHQDEIGLQLGKELVTGWAPGGNPPTMPPGVGMEMPPANGAVSMEIHYFNTTGSPQPDRSGVRMCVTFTKPEKEASLTWLGTEVISVPPGQQATAVGTCTPGGGATQDIHLLATIPHMHQIGTHMKTVINRSGGGGQDIVIDTPFEFLDQRTYEIDMVVHPGDTLTTTCTFQNTGAGFVGFGQSTTQEMCYNFIVAYPSGALPNPFGLGIEGNSNMCLR